MTTVTIRGWHYGFQKVNFTMLMKSGMGLTLSPAKKITDRILDGEPVELEIPNDRLDHLLAAMTELGAICEVAVQS